MLEKPPRLRPRDVPWLRKLSENQFFITGSSCTIEFKPASGAHRDWLRVEEAEPLARKPNASHNGRDYSPASAFRVSAHSERRRD